MKKRKSESNNIHIFSIGIALLDPPPFVLPVSSDSHSEQTMETVPHVDDLTARSELLAEVSKHHCWGLTAARELQIKDITHESAFHVSFYWFILSKPN